MANIITRTKGHFMRGGVRRREMFWLSGEGFGQTLVAPTTVALVLSLNVGGLSLRPFTIVRSRGELLVRSDQIAASEDYGVLFGGAVVSEQAANIGVTAVLTPLTNNDSQLFYIMETMIGSFRFSTAAGFRDVGVRRIIDSKAMRKVDQGQDIVAVVESAGANISTSGQFILGQYRTLIKLH